LDTWIVLLRNFDKLFETLGVNKIAFLLNLFNQKLTSSIIKEKRETATAIAAYIPK